jgi:ubiquinone/menaquinone biosynthesis C-methylase UbiE
MPQAQSLRTKRAEVEFHNFASMGQPEVVLADYRSKNERRADFLRANAGPIGPLSPFLEIGANAGHSSYMLVNDFGADGFALDISADALRHGAALMDEWGYGRAPVRIGGDAANLPFADGSLQFVVTYQTLSQFTGVESVFREARRVLSPGGVFLFAEEPLRRMLTLRLYRTPFVHDMSPREKRLYDAGLLGFFSQDVIGSRQEEIQAGRSSGCSGAVPSA